MITPSRLPLAILLSAGLLGFSACAEPMEKTADEQPAASPAKEADPVKPATPDNSDTKPAAPKPEDSPEAKAAAERRREIESLSLEKLRLETELQISQLKERAARLDAEGERMTLEAEAALRAARLAADNVTEDMTRAELDRDTAIANAKAGLARLRQSIALTELELDTKIAKQTADNEIARLGAISAKQKREIEARRVLDIDPARPTDPVVDGTLHISDRRIEINGLITDSTANDVISKLNFFSRVDAKAPVFLVFETCPGGSLMAGYQIRKAVESSRAPVHAVVKSAVGGVASAIVATAKHSYVIPHARIVFQQPASSARGTNLASQKDSLDVAEKWYALIHEPIAAKQGVSLTEFVARLYAHDANGDWLLFGDKAVEAKWVNTLVARIAEDAVSENPDKKAASGFAFFQSRLERRTDSSGQSYFALPPLAHGDAWSLYDPEHRYRAN